MDGVLLGALLVRRRKGETPGSTRAAIELAPV